MTDRRLAIFFCGIILVGLGPAIWLGSVLFRPPVGGNPPAVAVTADITGTPADDPAPSAGETETPPGGWQTVP
ncbi:hypothetical protein ACFQ0D_26890, partial [Micromonospora zhanjiangensis]